MKPIGFLPLFSASWFGDDARNLAFAAMRTAFLIDPAVGNGKGIHLYANTGFWEAKVYMCRMPVDSQASTMMSCNGMQIDAFVRYLIHFYVNKTNFVVNKFNNTLHDNACSIRLDGSTWKS